MELTWSLDYCLACDRQTSGGAYCSQSCRLADHETSSWSGSSSSRTAGNTTTTASTTSPSSLPSSASPRSSARHSSGSGFYLSPAINFDLYKTSTAGSPPASTSPPRLLSPSSSHSSLSSTQSNSSPKCNFSQQVHNELRAYTNSFDTTRNWRRRRTWS